MGEPNPDVHETEPDSALERRSWKATIKALLVSKWSLGIGALALIAAIATIIITPDDDPQPTNQVTAGGSINVNDSPCAFSAIEKCNITLQQAPNRPDEDVEKRDAPIKQELKSQATVPPSGNGPWPFVVIDTVDPGLLVRTTNTLEGGKLGIVPDLKTVWAECEAHSGFVPHGVTNETRLAGDAWVRVRWDGRESTPSGVQRGWMYRGALAPYQHTGAIPTCEPR